MPAAEPRKGGERAPRTGRGDPRADTTATRPGTRPRTRPQGAEQSRRRVGAKGETSVEVTTRVQRIDETLTRLTAAHAGLTLDGEPRRARRRPRRPTRQRPNLLRLAALAVAAVIVAAAGVGWGAQRWLAAAVPSAAALDPGSGAIVDAPSQAGDENVLLVATDRAATAGAPPAPTPSSSRTFPRAAGR